MSYPNDYTKMNEKMMQQQKEYMTQMGMSPFMYLMPMMPHK